jgi:hypothetical protein
MLPSHGAVQANELERQRYPRVILHDANRLVEVVLNDLDDNGLPLRSGSREGPVANEALGVLGAASKAERAHLLLGSDRGRGHHQLLKLGSLLEMSPSRGPQDVGRMRVTHEPCQFEAVLGLLEMIPRRFHNLPTI